MLQAPFVTGKNQPGIPDFKPFKCKGWAAVISIKWQTGKGKNGKARTSDVRGFSAWQRPVAAVRQYCIQFCGFSLCRFAVSS
jgi:hypothetical protein